MGHLLYTYAVVFALLIGFLLVLIAQTRDDKPRARPSLSIPTPAKEFFGAAMLGSLQKPQSFGSYAKGCLAGGLTLPETGPTWQAMRLVAIEIGASQSQLNTCKISLAKWHKTPLGPAYI